MFVCVCVRFFEGYSVLPRSGGGGGFGIVLINMSFGPAEACVFLMLL